MLAVEMTGDDAGCLELVVRGVAKSDRRGHQSIPQGLGHVRHDEPRIDAAAQKRAERHFAFQAIVDGLAQRGVDLPKQFLIALASACGHCDRSSTAR